ncbi:MAG: tryptophan-rich sensory protein [Lachnospiraceae bacterium]|nr:tryptophan-rich sensory protein [Lachnospiraceae bacterium]
MWAKLKPYVISIAIALGVGGLSAFFTRENMDIYERIIRPTLAPPAILFPIVWTILYTLMGISSARIWLQKEEKPELVLDALLAYAVQLFLNFFWSLIFFNMQNFLFSLIWLVLLWVAIIIMIIRFYRVEPLAALLQIPYLLWVTFAGYLNFMIYQLNP